jgi:N-acetylglucosamine-6-phosphate deacetylase
MKTYILNANLIIPNQIINGQNVVIENGKIIEITSSVVKTESGSVQIQAKETFLCPGFIDIHFHGALGKDTMDADLPSLQVLSNYCAEHGVTSFYPTTWAARPEDIMLAINNVKENQTKLTGAQALGIHIESPYINADFRGAQLQSMIRNPIEEEYHAWFDSGMVKLITCAPEITGGMEFIQEAVKKGIRISIGHSGATYDQVFEAADQGASQATHLFNGMLGLHHRNPGTVGGLPDDERISAQIICDGIHLHPATVRFTVKAKSASKVILITDSIRGAGLVDGYYEHKGQKIIVRNGTALTPEGGLSGSTLAMDTAIFNAMKFTGKSISEVVAMATCTPVASMGVSNLKGFIKEGYDADLVLLNKQWSVEQTIVGGKIVFVRNRNERSD